MEDNWATRLLDVTPELSSASAVQNAILKKAYFVGQVCSL
jgi:hypothetical protein